MWPARLLGKALTDHRPGLVGQHTADPRVGVAEEQGASGQDAGAFKGGRLARCGRADLAHEVEVGQVVDGLGSKIRTLPGRSIYMQRIRLVLLDAIFQRALDDPPMDARNPLPS